MAKGRRQAKREAYAQRNSLPAPRLGDWYVDPKVLAMAGSLAGFTGPKVRRPPQQGKRHTSARRRHMSIVQQASQLAAIADGGNQVDRHKPYVYGASPMRLRRPVIDRVNAAILSGEMKPLIDEIRG
jgi:hypothetical protein